MQLSDDSGKSKHDLAAVAHLQAGDAQEWHVLCVHSAHNNPTISISEFGIVYDGTQPGIQKPAHGLRRIVQGFECMSDHPTITSTELR